MAGIENPTIAIISEGYRTHSWFWEYEYWWIANAENFQEIETDQYQLMIVDWACTEEEADKIVRDWYGDFEM